jgi:hypothetical protein
VLHAVQVGGAEKTGFRLLRFRVQASPVHVLHAVQVGDVEKIVKETGLTDWHVTFNCSTAKKGYSGTATLCR